MIRLLTSIVSLSLQEQVKIAKWDDQSYYALKVSAKKSHRALFKLISAHGDILVRQVEPILSELADGKREPKMSAESPATPSEDVLPRLATELIKSSDVTVESILTSVAGATSFAEAQHLSNLSALTKRAEKYSRSFVLKGEEYHGQYVRGAMDVEELCSNIIERVQGLQGEDVLIASKQRALVDLFKMMKTQGISTRMNDIPAQSRQIQAVMSLPIPSVNMVTESGSSDFIAGAQGLIKGLWNRSDFYFYRNVSQLQRMRLSSLQPNRVSSRLLFCFECVFIVSIPRLYV